MDRDGLRITLICGCTFLIERRAMYNLRSQGETDDVVRHAADRHVCPAQEIRRMTGTGEQESYSQQDQWSARRFFLSNNPGTPPMPPLGFKPPAPVPTIPTNKIERDEPKKPELPDRFLLIELD
jgi:hypothetical protein